MTAPHGQTAPDHPSRNTRSDPLQGQEQEHAMTRSRKQNGNGKGTVVFVGAGPGDPELLTARASAAIAGADTVLVDPDVSAAVLEAVREANPDLELTPVSGEPAEVAKGAVAAA